MQDLLCLHLAWGPIDVDDAPSCKSPDDDDDDDVCVCVRVFVFNVPPTAKVIWRRGHGFKSHLTDWWSPESNLRPLVYKASGLPTSPRRLLRDDDDDDMIEILQWNDKNFKNL